MKVAPLVQPPNAEVIEGLEEALAHARSGKLQAVLFFGVDTATGDVAHWVRGVRSYAAFAWAIECWRHRVMHQTQEGL